MKNRRECDLYELERIVLQIFLNNNQTDFTLIDFIGAPKEIICELFSGVSDKDYAMQEIEFYE